jgi:hypothetical protein
VNPGPDPRSSSQILLNRGLDQRERVRKVRFRFREVRTTNWTIFLRSQHVRMRGMVESDAVIEPLSEPTPTQEDNDPQAREKPQLNMHDPQLTSRLSCLTSIRMVFNGVQPMCVPQRVYPTREPVSYQWKIIAVGSTPTASSAWPSPQWCRSRVALGETWMPAPTSLRTEADLRSVMWCPACASIRDCWSEDGVTTAGALG